MLIYRLENEEGIGIFKSGLVSLAWHEVRLEVEDRHLNDPFRGPECWEDVNFFPDKNPKLIEYYCGFISMEQLFSWFNSDILLAELNKLGGMLAVYEIPLTPVNVVQGHHQVVFLKNKAERIYFKPIPITKNCNIIFKEFAY